MADKEPNPDTKAYMGPDMEGSLTAIPEQQKTRVTRRPHRVEEDQLPLGEMDIRGLKKRS